MITVGNTSDGGAVKVKAKEDVVAVQQVKRPDEKEGGTIVFLSSGQAVQVADKIDDVEARLVA